MLAIQRTAHASYFASRSAFASPTAFFAASRSTCSMLSRSAFALLRRICRVSVSVVVSERQRTVTSSFSPTSTTG